jgi:hypothetical protein
MKTVGEILELQKKWLADPTWNMWKVEGFEGYEYMLRPFQERMRAKTKDERAS